MCTILVNCLEDKACPVKVCLGKLTALDMTPLGLLGRKTSTQTFCFPVFWNEHCKPGWFLYRIEKVWDRSHPVGLDEWISLSEFEMQVSSKIFVRFHETL